MDKIQEAAISNEREKLRLLIVEDEALIAIAVEQMVEDAGFLFETSVNGDDAIAILEDSNQSFSALVTDIRIPGQATGWDVARRARELYPSIPVIYMTGDSTGEWTAYGVPESILLQKPFAEVQLTTGLATLLNDVRPLA
ncbi:response regulator [Pararhizobium arenae]|uniref:response regulator n=1 Tax=Pararhizobium arenae TaxID=1856850 RepID=UPI00094B4815|nr:response regulator [Pararhizobium arenae]